MKRIIGLVVLSTVILLCVPCYGGELTRAEALKLIINKKYGDRTSSIETKHKVGEMKYRYLPPGSDPKQYFKESSDARNRLEQLKKQGYITIQEESPKFIDASFYYPIHWITLPTDKLRKYIIGQAGFAEHIQYKLLVGVYVIDKVTGITKHPSDASARVVEFTIKLVQNEEQKLLTNLLEGDFLEVKPNTNEIYSTTFKEYDDGWRVMQRFSEPPSFMVDSINKGTPRK